MPKDSGLFQNEKAIQSKQERAERAKKANVLKLIPELKLRYNDFSDEKIQLLADLLARPYNLQREAYCHKIIGFVEEFLHEKDRLDALHLVLKSPEDLFPFLVSLLEKHELTCDNIQKRVRPNQEDIHLPHP
jgi:hypothetical protein